MDYQFECRVPDLPEDLCLRLYCDTDFAGGVEDAYSTSGGYIVLYGPNTWFPLMWLAKRHTSTSRSATEAEVVSLAHYLFLEALPLLSLWDIVLGRRVELHILEDDQATIKVVVKGYYA